MECKLESTVFTGLLGPVWTEETRTAEQVHEMLFPRLISLAERAWHKATWEETGNTQERIQQTNMEWTAFAKSMANKELGRLEKIGIQYRIPLPGARWAMVSFLFLTCLYMYVCLSVCMSPYPLYFCLSGQSGLFSFFFISISYIFHYILSTLFSPALTPLLTMLMYIVFLVGQCMQDHELSFFIRWLNFFFPDE